MMNTQNVMTIEETAETFSKEIPEWQKQANLDWLRGIHAMLKDDGVWASPELGTIYMKRGDGFIKMEDKNDKFILSK
jgi:hypothetical protein